MLKIGILSPFPPEKDGIAIYSDNILRGLKENKKHIVTIGRKASNSDYRINFKSFRLKRDLKKIIKKEKLDLLNIQYVPTLFGKYTLNYNLIRALDQNIPVIVTLHEVHYSTKGLRNKILALIEKNIIKKAKKIIVHTPKQQEFLQRKYRTKKIITIYHGLRLNNIPKRKNKKNILCFGMISKGKGIPYLIRAMKYLPDYSLTIAGGFVDKEVKQEILTSLNRSKAKIKTSFRWIDEKEKERLYKEANIVVLPHTWAPYQSGILHNSVAWSLPVVVTRTGALYEMVERFGFGEVVPSRNPKALAQGIKKVFKNYDHYKKGLETYRKEANWPKIADEHMKLFKKFSR